MLGQSSPCRDTASIYHRWIRSSMRCSSTAQGWRCSKLDKGWAQDQLPKPFRRSECYAHWRERSMAEQKQTPSQGHNGLRIEIVTKLEQFMHVMAIRAICYMEDTTFPADQA